MTSSTLQYFWAVERAKPAIKVGDTIVIRDDEVGNVSGKVISFNHEGLPMVQFPEIKIEVFPDMIVEIRPSLMPAPSPRGSHAPSKPPRPVWEKRA